MAKVLVIVLCFCVNFSQVFCKKQTPAYALIKNTHQVNSRVYNIQSFQGSEHKNTLEIKVVGKVPVLQEGYVKDLEKLQRLTLADCGISEISKQAFQNVPALSVVHLQDNKITSITSGIFDGLGITELYLHRNDISSIDSDAFDNMPKLTLIKLNKNNIKIYDPNWFKNCPELTEVFFRRNSIRELPANAFKHFKFMINPSSPNASGAVYLSKNLISKIHSDAFKGVKKIDKLYLDRNKLKTLSPELFSRVKVINMLYLRRNKISSLQPTLFQSCDHVFLVDVSKNPLSCISESVAQKVRLIELEGDNIDCACIAKLKNLIVSTENEISTGDSCTEKNSDGDAERDNDDEEGEDDEDEEEDEEDDFEEEEEGEEDAEGKKQNEEE